MMMRAVLCASLAANIGLAIYAAQTAKSPKPAHADAPVVAANTSGVAPATTQPQTITWREAKDAYSRAKAAGLDEPLARRVLAASLQAMPDWTEPYWKSPVTRETERQQAEFDFQSALRRDLVELVGPGAVDELAFRSLFFPLAAKLPFLSSEQQIGIQEIKLQEQRRLLQESGGHGGFQHASAIFQDTLQQIRKILSEEQFFEYELRVSPAAQVLAGNGFDFTEEEFRKVFRASGGQSAIRFQGLGFTLTGQPNGSDKTLAAIETALGPQRFAEYRRAQDPTFKLLAAIGADRGIEPGAIDKAYDIIVATAARRNQIHAGGPLMTGAQRESLKNIESEQQAELSKLLGPQALEVFNQSLNPQLPVMGGGALVRPRGIVAGASPR
ncbi:hypothetical protein [Steroidobacter flavus]